MVNGELWIAALYIGIHRLLLTADCLLNLRGVRVGGALGQCQGLRQDVTLAGKEETSVTSKNDERRGNVIENKGPLWKTRRQSGNVVENKHSYPQYPGMLLKTKEVDGMS
ncbi:MAG: hypothetical protein WB763_11830 [Terriglobia bacterium]|jgi:hypothetical protein